MLKGAKSVGEETESEVVESSMVYVVATVNVRSLYPTIYDVS